MEADENHTRSSAGLMVASLAGSLAHVTCKVDINQLLMCTDNLRLPQERNYDQVQSVIRTCVLVLPLCHVKLNRHSCIWYLLIFISEERIFWWFY